MGNSYKFLRELWSKESNNQIEIVKFMKRDFQMEKNFPEIENPSLPYYTSFNTIYSILYHRCKTVVSAFCGIFFALQN